MEQWDFWKQTIRTTVIKRCRCFSFLTVCSQIMFFSPCNNYKVFKKRMYVDRGFTWHYPFNRGVWHFMWNGLRAIAEGSPKFTHSKFLYSIKLNKNMFPSTATWILQATLFIEFGMGLNTSPNRYRGSTLRTSQVFVNEWAFQMKPHHNHDSKFPPSVTRKWCKEKKGGGITKENYVKEYFQQQTFVMLMVDGTKARTITCQFYAWNWK